MKLDIDKKTKFEKHLKELLKDGDAIANGLSGIELGEFSHENIRIHKWCTSLILLIEGTLDNNSLLIEDIKNASKKAKRPHELFEKALGVAKAVEESCRSGDLDNRFM